MTNILDTILAGKADEVRRKRRAVSLTAMRAQAESAAPPRDFVGAINHCIAADRPAAIAELKHASPSRGVLRADFDPPTLARNLAAGGAACLSVLTDEHWFGGRGRYVQDARAACDLPVLRKEFIVDAYQVFESRALGADAVLLIVAALDDDKLIELTTQAAELGMAVLMEVHTPEELARAAATPARLIGINNRDLRTFETRIATTIELHDMLPGDRIAVSESGIGAREDIELLRRHDVHAFLIGETLMRAADPGAKLAELLAV